MFGGFAGAFFATRQGFISPESFTFIESALILAIVVLGGMGSQLGVARRGARHDRRLRAVPRVRSEYRMLVFGLAMVLIMVWRPRGLVSTREPSVRSEQGISASSSRKATVSRRPSRSSTVEHLTMRFGGLVAVDDLSFTPGAARSPR